MNPRIKTLIVAFGMSLLVTMPLQADKRQDYQSTYNYKRAIELANDNKTDEAKDFFLKELADHPDNGYALAWLASLQKNDEQTGEAFKNISQAMKYLDKKDSFYSFSLGLRSSIYKDLGDKKSALSDLNTLVKLFPKDPESFQKRGEFYLDEDQYELANQDFLTMTQVEPGNSLGFAGSGVCLRNLKRYDEALTNFTKALTLDSQYSAAYAQRGYIYFLTKKYSDASDDISKSLAMDGNDLAFQVMQDIADSSFEDIDFKLKIQQMMQPNNFYWPYCRAMIREHVKQYTEAIPMYDASNQLKFSDLTLRRMATCKEKIGDFQGALNCIDQALQMDSTSVILLYYRQDYLTELGRGDEAVDVCSRMIELAPNYSIGYSQRSQVKSDLGDLNGALEDITMAIMIDKDMDSYYVSRGNIYLQLGKREQALKDYKSALEYDTIPSEYSSALFALYELGENNKLAAAIDSVLTADSISNAYNIACIYSRMGKTEKSLNFLKKALDDNYLRFYHMEHDYDLANIRKTQEYQTLLAQYRNKLSIYSNNQGSESSVSENFEYEVEEVPFTHENGVTKVKCTINDLPLHFIFDTGAADVSISSLEATFMLKNGYLSDKDISGKAYYQTANGTISEGTIINLRKVKFGSVELENVKASVVNNQSAPLLLGQTVFQRLGKIEIDNTHNVLKIMKRKK